jgi:hypothetical protein
LAHEPDLATGFLDCVDFNALPAILVGELLRRGLGDLLRRAADEHVFDQIETKRQLTVFQGM